MKVCKKCKKQVANKTKICKYCGADVSKAKIIKKEQPAKKTKVVEKQEIKKIEEVIEVKKIEIEKKEEKQKVTKKAKEAPKLKKEKIQKETSSILKTKIIDKIKNKKIKNILIKFDKVNKKKLIIITIVLVIFLSITISIIKLYCFVNNTANTVIPNKENQKTVFSMKDKITYKDVDYKIIKVETSNGTKLKRPKKGNEFVIVTLKIENRSDTKVKYSYQNWKMTNSLDEEKSRIFAPVNATTALYTGNLVIGGTKTGSMVFEQPQGDDKLRLNFYEIEEPKEETKEENNDKELSEEKEEKQKPIFTIIIPQVSEKPTEKEENNTKAQ